MIDYYQETDTKIIFHVPAKWESSNLSQYSNATSGSGARLDSNYFDLSPNINIIYSALRVVNQSENQEIVHKAKNLLQAIQDIINSFIALNFEIRDLPPLHAFHTVDGGVIIEWIFRDFRLGFSFEKKIEESGCYLITTSELGGISASGYLPKKENIDELVIWLLNFALSHS